MRVYLAHLTFVVTLCSEKAFFIWTPSQYPLTVSNTAERLRKYKAAYLDLLLIDPTLHHLYVSKSLCNILCSSFYHCYNTGPHDIISRLTFQQTNDQHSSLNSSARKTIYPESTLSKEIGVKMTFGEGGSFCLHKNGNERPSPLLR